MKPEFYFGSKQRLQTVLGGLLSICCYVVGVIGTCFFSLDFLQKTNPIVNLNTYYSLTSQIELTRNNFYVKMGIFDASSLAIPNYEQYYRVVLKTFFYNYYTDPNTNERKLRLNTTDVGIQKCTDEYMKNNYPQYVSHPYENMYCLEPNFNLTMMNPLGSIGENKFLNIYFAFCDNKTLPESAPRCKSMDEIKEKLKTFTLKFAFSDYYIDHNNYTNPYQAFINT
jgi:hypothetical protein